MDKQAIRLEYRQRRRDVPLSERVIKSQGIQQLFFSDPRIMACLHRPGAVVHTYLPIRRQREVDTWPIIHRLWDDFPQVRIWSSLTDADTNTLQSFPLTTETPLTETKWGIPVPIGTFEPVVGQPDLVIVPLLAFDKQGHRVGYGGGYYDRFLAEAGPDCLKIGLSFFEPLDHISGVEQTDVRLDGCISPEKQWWF